MASSLQRVLWLHSAGRTMYAIPRIAAMPRRLTVGSGLFCNAGMVTRPWNVWDLGQVRIAVYCRLLIPSG